MNVLDIISEVSSYYKQIKGTTVFYSVPHDVETALIKGKNAMNAMAEIGQRHINNLYDRNNIALNTTAKEHKPKKYEKRCERIEVALKEKKKIG